MRRLVVELPPSRAARWSGRLAVFAAMVCGLAVVLGRLDRIELQAALAAIGAGLLLAVAAAVLAGIAFVSVWQDGRPGFRAALGGLVVAVALVAWPVVLAIQALHLPRLADVTTDVVDPPAFSRSRRAIDARGGVMPPDPAPESRLAQQAAYPALTPLTLELGIQDAFILAQKAVQQRGWQLVEAVGPGPRTTTGRIDAVDRSLLLRIPADVTIRLRTVAGGTRVDLRAASRSGAHDLGENARRIQAFVQALNELVEARD